MSTELLINVTPRETRIALVEHGALQEVFIDRESCRGKAGNIYKGKVTRVLPGMQAAFVDIGLERAAFLHASDIVARSQKGQAVDPEQANIPCSDEDGDCGVTQQNDRRKTPPENAVGPEGTDRRRQEDRRSAQNLRKKCPSITELVQEGQELLVQVIKDPIGTKGARLTAHISLTSRYVVYMPYNPTIGISQRIEDEDERHRLKEAAENYLKKYTQEHPDPNHELPENYPYRRASHGGIILRTAAVGLSEENLHADLDYVTQLWRSIQRNGLKDGDSRSVHEELPLIMKTLREVHRTDIDRIRIDSEASHKKVRDFVTQFVPDMETRIEHFQGENPIFDLYGIEDEIQNALERQVPLKSGGYLVMDQTEAMTTIDVNTGTFVGKRNLEETIFKTNLEAVHAIARQLRLRNLGGIIIIDFIDMCNEDHKRQVLRTLENCLEKDSTKTQISEVSALGLVQMTRKRTHDSLEHILCEPCPTCAGRGSMCTAETVSYRIFRDIMREAKQYGADKLLVLAAHPVVDYLHETEHNSIERLEKFLDTPIEIQVEPMYTQEQYDIVLM